MPLKVMKTPPALPFLCAALVLGPLPHASAFSQGAKPSSCEDMTPGHIRAQPQDPHHSHVTLQAGASSYLPGETVPVAVRSNRDFMGFLIQARTVLDDRVTGSFVLIPPGSRLLGCVDVGDTVTHSDKLLKRNLSFIWRAPDRPLGDIRFLITVVQSYFVYWARIESAVVNDGTEIAPNLMGGGGGRALPESQVDIAERTSQAQPSGSVWSREGLTEGHTQREEEDQEEDSSTSSPPPTTPSEDPTVLAPPTGLVPLKTPPAPSQIGITSQRPSATPQPCLHCKHEGESSNGPGPEESAPLTPLTEEAATEPQQPQRSPLMARDPEPEAGSSPTPLEPSPAPRRLHSDPATQAAPADPPQPTPGPASRVQKGGVARNLSRAGDTGPPKEVGSGGKVEKNPGPVSQRNGLELGVLLGCSAGLGMVLAVGLRYLHSQYCLKRTAVSLSDRHADGGGIIHVQDSGELVQVRKIRQNSFVLLQAEYNVLTPPGN